MRDYRERLAVPIAWWLLAVPVILILGAYGIYANLNGTTVVIVYIVIAAVYLATLVSWGATSVEVGDGQLRAGRDVLPLGQVTEVVALDPAQSAAMRGPRADPAAHMLLRPFLKQAVYIAVQDPAGQVPYWLVGTRHPVELAAVIERSRPRDAPAESRGSAG